MIEWNDPQEMLLMARQKELEARSEAADRNGPQVEAAMRARHDRHRAALRRLLDQVEAALQKGREGTYGQCDSCGQPISAQDLQHEPATTLCRDCRGHQS